MKANTSYQNSVCKLICRPWSPCPSLPSLKMSKTPCQHRRPDAPNFRIGSNGEHFLLIAVKHRAASARVDYRVLCGRFLYAAQGHDSSRLSSCDAHDQTIRLVLQQAKARGSMVLQLMGYVRGL